MFLLKRIEFEYSEFPGSSYEEESVCNDDNTGIRSFPEKKNSGGPKLPVFGDKVGFQVIRYLDFWLITITFLVGVSTQSAVYSNMGTYLRSFGQEKNLVIFMLIYPIIGITTEIIGGVLSDKTQRKVSRVVYIVFVLLVQLVLLVCFIFIGDQTTFTFIYFPAVCIIKGLTFLHCSILPLEYFGSKHYGRNFGATLLGLGLTILMLMFFLGHMYDATIEVSGVLTCYGLQCFFVSTLVLCGFTTIALGASVLLFLRKPVLTA